MLKGLDKIRVSQDKGPIFTTTNRQGPLTEGFHVTSLVTTIEMAENPFRGESQDLIILESRDIVPGEMIVCITWFKLERSNMLSL